MEYQVPQFIEAEDKIVGPLTFKQFLYMAGAVGLCTICFVSFNFIVAVLLSIPIIALAVMLAFYKINGKPFIEMLEAGFNYFVGAKLFLWKRKEPKAEAPTVAATAAQEAAAAHAARMTPKLTRGKLSELAWSLDVNTPREPGT